jgi:UDP-N-acetylmuramoyl-L-alanyl-D-glutamate--2,6-diaminopimelate ligase
LFKAEARLAANFYDSPCTKLNLIGITGSKGKTTTLYILESILKAAGLKTGILSTVETKIGLEIIPARLTTPESPDLQALLFRMLNAGITHVPLEATSHALSMNRLLGCDFDRVIFTNISHDHLDFHGTFDNYRSAKLKLFDMVKPNAVSLVNADDWSADYFLQRTKGKCITYGIKGEAEVMARDIYNIGIKMTTFKLKSPAGETQIETHLVGLFNVYNILAAAACGLSYGISPETIKKATKETANIPGRFEKIDCGQDFSVVVDFAHSPESLRNLLETARSGTNTKVILVFGCPGDRDRIKRTMMGELAAKLADFSIVTNDNPQSEDPEQIMDEIEVGLIRGGGIEGKNYLRVDGRKTAIQYAIDMGAKDDIVLIAGRGHEKYQDFHGIKIDLDL